MKGETLMMPTGKTIGARLRKLRGTRTKAVVAKNLGCTPQAIALWESGDRVPRDAWKVKLAAYYKRSVAGIFYKEE